jgi:glycosyltransferase involved in cell wall biosynthesis
MKIAFIADGRSDHSRRWISYFASNCEVLLLSPFQCKPLAGVKIVTLPGRFRLGGELSTKSSGEAGQRVFFARLVSRMVRSNLANRVWTLLKLTDLFAQVGAVRAALRAFQPDVLHALRVQNEGYLAAFSGTPDFILSSWGSDFIDTAANSLVHRALTRIALRKTRHFMADCERDLNLADKFGLPPGARKYNFPGNGGVNGTTFFPPEALSESATILYCRGVSRVTRLDTLFDGIAQFQQRTGLAARLAVLAPTATHDTFHELARRSGMSGKTVRVLDYVDPPELAQFMREHTLFVSPLVSDGVPNSMLEAMACGMIPVMSELESIREFVVDGKNGFLFDPDSAQSLSIALERSFAARKGEFRRDNSDMIRTRLEYFTCLDRVKRLYEEMKKNKYEVHV